MVSRALIVLLLVLNVGVAAWWALRPAAVPAMPGQPRGVASLQLLSEMPRVPPRRPSVQPPVPDNATVPDTETPAAAVPAAEGVTEAPITTTQTAVMAPRCFSFGPFETADAAAAARARLQPLVQRIAVRTRAAGPARGWRVYLPPQPDAEAAKAMAKRIADAGFSDYLVLHNGSDANAIALGRYGSEATARHRVETLSAAGFNARAEPVGGGDATTWLDVAVAPAFDAARAQTIAGAPGRQSLDCARLQQ